MRFDFAPNPNYYPLEILRYFTHFLCITIFVAQSHFNIETLRLLPIKSQLACHPKRVTREMPELFTFAKK